MKAMLMVLLMLVSVQAGSIWADYYGDAIFDTRSVYSVSDTYYGLMRAGASFEHGDVFLSYYQYGMYGLNDQLSYVGLGAKSAFEWDKVILEPFIIIHRDFGLDDNGVWFGVYVRGTIWEWGKKE